MNKTLLKSVREYKKQSVLAPFFVILEVLMEVLIPMEMAKIIDVGIMQGNLSYIVRRGLILVIMAMLALYFGIIAGKMAATAGARYYQRTDGIYDEHSSVGESSDHDCFILDHDTFDQ